ncbi:NAD(FAD)-dependent dehydrogenase [Synergistales bacterium]|nr:NAD(FAD)-dependent dehydrogenase [Synergistales bacterium]
MADAINTETKKFLCVSCPVGCALTVSVQGTKVIKAEGNTCKLGLKYAENEAANPLRTFTSTVRVDGASLPVCPVRSRTPLPLAKMFDVTREVAKLHAVAPVKMGQVLINDVCGTGTDIVASRSLG